MILGRIVGKVSTKNFNFRIENRAEKFEYIQVMHEGKYVLGQIIEIEKDIEKVDQQIAQLFVPTTKKVQGANLQEEKINYQQLTTNY